MGPMGFKGLGKNGKVPGDTEGGEQFLLENWKAVLKNVGLELDLRTTCAFKSIQKCSEALLSQPPTITEHTIAECVLR